MRTGVGPQALPEKFRSVFPGHRFVVVSNREPYEHVYDHNSGDVVVRRPAGGLTSALDPLLQALSGDWVAWGSGDADHDVADERGSVRVPPEDPRYTLHRVWLDTRDIEEYYLGYSNQVLWPLCHLRPALTRVRAKHWVRYQDVNAKFGNAVMAAAGEQPSAIWFQDYHLALAPSHVRGRLRQATLAHFWHIPWPPPEVFRIASRGGEILKGLLANDLVGFHLPSFCANFLRCVGQQLGMPVDWERRCVHLEGHTCWVRAFPISIDIGVHQTAATASDADLKLQRMRARYAPAGGQIGIGVDRVDYSKGLEEKLKALDFMWERYPDAREKFTFVQVAVPSRTDIDAYDQLNEKIGRMALSINERYGTDTWRPIYLLKESLPPERLALLYRLADLCIVASLQDGMNLVAKEYVASQVDQNGVLLLSSFAGASEELAGSVPINPYDPEDFARRIHEALRMPIEDRRERMQRLQSSLRDIYDWLAEIFELWGAAAKRQDVPLAWADSW